MAKYTDAKCRQCRREQAKLYLKGAKCHSDKCPVTRRQTLPGVHSVSRSRPTSYGIQFREKQKVKRSYGLLEKQFRRFYNLAASEKGNTGVRLLQLLEMRLDNVVYKVGFAKSKFAARQLVGHGHITVNGKKIDIPSYILKVGDVVAVKDSSAAKEFMKNTVDSLKDHKVPDWLERDKGLISRVSQVPAREMIDPGIQEQLIVELYSR